MFQIRDLQRATGAAGRPSWTATLVEGDVRVRVDRHTGSWIARSPEGDCHVLPEFAARLQAKVRPMEKAEQRAAEPEGVAA